MSGPTVAIITPKKIEGDILSGILEIIKNESKGFLQSEKEFTLNNRSYGWAIGEEYDGELIEIQNELSGKVDWRPLDIFCLIAHGNIKEVDSPFLGKLCCEILERTTSMVAFGGWLEDYTRDKAILHHPGVFYCKRETFFSKDAFVEWLQHKDFELI